MIYFLVLFVLSSTLAQRNLLDRAVGPCINGQCPPGHGCLFDQCVPSPDPSTGVGPCIGGSCPRGTFCFNQECFRAL